LRQRIVDLAKQSMTVNSGFSRYSLTGTSNLTTILPRSGRTDCSQWIAAVYHKAGAGSPGTYTGDMIGKGRRTSNPKPADLLISSSHVEMYIGGGKTIGHGSPPIDYSTVDYWTAQGFYFITYSFLD
jgi:cell wall-associated NlpC family hydrolase